MRQTHYHTRKRLRNRRSPILKLLKDLHAKGLTDPEIADELSHRYRPEWWGPDSVRYWRRKLKLPANQRRYFREPLSHARQRVLDLLRREGPLTRKEIVGKLGYHHPRMSGSIDHLATLWEFGFLRLAVILDPQSCPPWKLLWHLPEQEVEHPTRYPSPNKISLEIS